MRMRFTNQLKRLFTNSTRRWDDQTTQRHKQVFRCSLFRPFLLSIVSHPTPCALCSVHFPADTVARWKEARCFLWDGLQFKLWINNRLLQLASCGFGRNCDASGRSISVALHFRRFDFRRVAVARRLAFLQTDAIGTLNGRSRFKSTFRSLSLCVLCMAALALQQVTFWRGIDERVCKISLFSLLSSFFVSFRAFSLFLDFYGFLLFFSFFLLFYSFSSFYLSKKQLNER